DAASRPPTGSTVRNDRAARGPLKDTGRGSVVRAQLDLSGQPGEVLRGAAADRDLQDLRVGVRVQRLQLLLRGEGLLRSGLQEKQGLVLALQASFPPEERVD